MTEASYDHEVFEKLEEMPGNEFEDCTFIDCNLADGDWSGYFLTDCRFVDCNLSTIKVNKSNLRSVDFVNCKAIGVDFSQCLTSLFSVSFEKCCLDYSIFIKCRLRKTKFTGCLVREADFTDADMTGAQLDGCDLKNTIFNRTNLSQADLRTAYNYSINLETNTAKKAKFSLLRLSGLLRQYDIIIEH
jgi:fluoroquinolone resistance protein